MQKLNLKIGHLYSSLMNTYGDDGNIIVLIKRCRWRGIEVVSEEVKVGNKIRKGQYDLYFFGGGQDQAQELIAKDLVTKAETLQGEVAREVPVLSICGGYQLLGDYYQPFSLASQKGDAEPHKGPKLGGLGIFKAYTQASFDRMIGNIVIDTEEFGKLVGFENHSGKTHLKSGATPLGKVIKGFGNNGEDKTEGCIYKNAIGCYMHGSLLPKNPILADWLIKKALEVKYGEKIELEPLDDELENKAHDLAVTKFG